MIKISRKRKLCGTMLIISICVLVLLSVVPTSSMAKTKRKTYTITTNTKPCNKAATYSTYNKYTKSYYVILSYLQRLEKEGGGTLVLSKGTYTISNTLYVPSNVTIRLKDGVKIVKGKKTGTKKFGPSHSIFQLCSYTKSSKKGAYSKYNGESNISIVGEGKAIIDLSYHKDTVGIMLCHNQNVKISGIQFLHMYSGHFIEVDASKNVSFTKCSFSEHKNSPNNNKEAINLDTPDRTTEGFHAVWTSYDKTPNDNILVSDCKFKNLERAVGTHKYSENKLHKAVKILNNSITNCDQDAIRAMNWWKPVIKDNTITNVANKASGKRGILLSGVTDPQIENNTFTHVSRPMQFIAWKNSGGGSKYPIIYNHLSEQSLEMLKNNTLKDGDEYFIRINHKYNVYDKNTDKIPLNQ